jgi:hypothetical protein
MKMRVPGIVAVMVLSAASMWAQAASTSPATAAAPDAAKPANHAACKHEMGAKKMCHCMRNKDGKMAKEMDGNKKGSCPRMKKEAEKKS